MKLEKKSKKKLSRSNTWETLKSKLKNLGYASAISTTLLISSCGNRDSDLTKLSKEHDGAVENVETQKEELGKAKKELKEAQEKVKEEQQDVEDAQKEAAELRTKLQKAKIDIAK